MQYRSKGLQHYTRVKRVYYTHITRSGHAPYTQITQNACNYTGDISRSSLDIACKLTRIRSTVFRFSFLLVTLVRFIS